MLKKSISIVVISILVLTLVFPILCIVKADTIKLVVSLGADLTKKQQDQILKFMEVERDEISIIETTIEEEAKYLKNTPAIKHIGNKTISSAQWKDWIKMKVYQ